MIIQVRGTSGSGKSTAVRAVMAAVGGWEPVFAPGRRRPLYYRSEAAGAAVAVLGHYETPCGGCDTVGSAAAVYELVLGVRPLVAAVLCEGLLLSEDVKWSSRLDGLVIYFLNTPPARCLDHVRARRRAAGDTRPLDPANTENRVRTIERARVRLAAAGVECRRCSAPQAPRLVLARLRAAAAGKKEGGVT